MKKMPAGKRIALLLIILCLAFIWGQSLLDGDASGQESGWVFRVVYPVLRCLFGEANATEHFLRKTAHFLEYAVLGTCLFLYFRYEKLCVPKSMNAALLAALADESLQLLSRNRGPQISDVWLDFSGAAAMVLLLWVLFRAAGVLSSRKSGGGRTIPDDPGR